MLYPGNISQVFRESSLCVCACLHTHVHWGRSRCVLLLPFPVSHTHSKPEKPQPDLFLPLTALLPQLRLRENYQVQTRTVGYESCHVVMWKAPAGASGDLVPVQSLSLRMNVTMGKLLILLYLWSKRTGLMDLWRPLFSPRIWTTRNQKREQAKKKKKIQNFIMWCIIIAGGFIYAYSERVFLYVYSVIDF